MIRLAAEIAKRERAESDLDTAERAVASKESAIQALLKDKQRALAKNTELAKENDQLKQALAETKSGLEDETLKRVDLENANQSLVEDLAFKQELYKQVSLLLFFFDLLILGTFVFAGNC